MLSLHMKKMCRIRLYVTVLSIPIPIPNDGYLDFVPVRLIEGGMAYITVNQIEGGVASVSVHFLPGMFGLFGPSMSPKSRCIVIKVGIHNDLHSAPSDGHAMSSVSFVLRTAHLHIAHSMY